MTGEMGAVGCGCVGAAVIDFFFFFLCFFFFFEGSESSSSTSSTVTLRLTGTGATTQGLRHQHEKMYMDLRLGLCGRVDPFVGAFPACIVLVKTGLVPGYGVLGVLRSVVFRVGFDENIRPVRNMSER